MMSPLRNQECQKEHMRAVLRKRLKKVHPVGREMARQKLPWCDVLRLSILANLLPDSRELSDPVIFLRQI